MDYVEKHSELFGHNFVHHWVESRFENLLGVVNASHGSEHYGKVGDTEAMNVGEFGIGCYSSHLANDTVR
eukprot:11661147-Alexandrium_andersonii.AAC.1